MKIGVDWGGTKIEAIAIDPNSGCLLYTSDAADE